MSQDAIRAVLEDCHGGSILPGVQDAQKAVLAHEQALLEGSKGLPELLAEVRQPFVTAWEKAIKEQGQRSPEAMRYLDAMNYLKW